MRGTIRQAGIGLLACGLALPAAEMEPLPFPDMALHVGHVIAKRYYDADRVNPPVMVERALWSLEASEISLDTVWTDTAIELRVGSEMVSVPAPRPTDLRSAMVIIERMRDALETIEQFSDAERRNLAYAMLNGALQTLDPHTLILPPEPADEFAEEIRGEFFGIGAYLSQVDGVVRIDRVMPGMPADQGGVRDGDLVLAVDGERIVGLSLAQAVARIKGPKGSEVVLTVERGSEPAELLELPIIRDRIRLITMRSFRSGSIGYVRMDHFNDKAAGDLFTEMLRLRAASDQPMRGFILDLRFNSGGLLSQAKAISNYYLTGDQVIVRTVQRGRRDGVSRSGDRTELDLPMLVLVGPGSASASEIVAGALQLNNRAAVIGRATFGKGSVQSLADLPDGSNLKLTIQDWRLSGGASIQQTGIVPDIELLPHQVAGDGSVDLTPYSFRREADDEFAITGAGAYEHDVAYRMGWVREYRTEDQMREHAISSREFTPDQEAELAIELLAAAVDDPETYRALGQSMASNTMRQVLLERMQPLIEQRRAAESDELAEALAAAPSPITWGPDAQPSASQLVMRYVGPVEVGAGEETALRFEIENTGPTPVGRLHGLVRTDLESPLWEDEVAVGAIDAGATVAVDMAFSVPPRSFTTDEHFVLDLYHDENEAPIGSLPVDVTVVGADRPRLGLGWALSDPAPLTLDHERVFELTIHNHGDAETAPLTLVLFKDNDAFVQLGEGRFRVDPLPAGGQTTLSIPVTVRSSYEVAGRKRLFDAESVSLQVRVGEVFEDTVDGRYGHGLFQAIEVPIGQPLEPAAVVQPSMRMTDLSVTDGVAEFTITGVDDDAAWLSVFRDDEKVAMQSLDDAGSEAFEGRYRVRLIDGLNELRIIATDHSDTSALLVRRLWHHEQPMAANQPRAATEE